MCKQVRHHSQGWPETVLRPSQASIFISLLHITRRQSGHGNQEKS